jgi:hypothetical protein
MNELNTIALFLIVAFVLGAGVAQAFPSRRTMYIYPVPVPETQQENVGCLGLLLLAFLAIIALAVILYVLPGLLGG